MEAGGEIFNENLTFDIFEKPSDVYSFGVILWQLVTGQQCPYEKFNYTSENLMEYVVNGGRPATPCGITNKTNKNLKSKERRVGFI